MRSTSQTAYQSAAEPSPEAVSCSVCNGHLVRVLQDVHDTRFGIPLAFDIGECAGCGVEHLMPVPGERQLGEFYESHYNFGGDNRTPYIRQRERFLSSALYRVWLALDGDISFHGAKGYGRLLDVGCNQGRGLSIYERNGFDAEGVEPNRVAAREARTRGFLVHDGLLEEFEPSEPFDVVVLANVLEHSTDPRGMLREARRVLRRGGQIWVSCPNSDSWLRGVFGRSWINWHVPFHIVHFSEPALGGLLREAGFGDVRVRHLTPSLWVAQSVIASMFSRPGRPTRQLRMAVPVAGCALAARGLFFPALWLGNRLGKGDCLAVTARRD